MILLLPTDIFTVNYAGFFRGHAFTCTCSIANCRSFHSFLLRKFWRIKSASCRKLMKGVEIPSELHRSLLEQLSSCVGRIYHVVIEESSSFSPFSIDLWAQQKEHTSSLSHFEIRHDVTIEQKVALFSGKQFPQNLVKFH